MSADAGAASNQAGGDGNEEDLGFEAPDKG